jgi:hypothetical protein
MIDQRLPVTNEPSRFIRAVSIPPCLARKYLIWRGFELVSLAELVLPFEKPAPWWAGWVKNVAMRAIPAEVWATFERRMDQARVPTTERLDYP